MKDKGILFRGELVLKILKDLKWETRRLAKAWAKTKKGQRLWIRETWACCYHGEDHFDIIYAADGSRKTFKQADHADWFHRQMDVHGETNCPGIHMPRWMSRVILECTKDGRLEKLHDIDEEGAKAEGANPIDRPTAMGRPYRLGFCMLWETIHEKDAPWDSNPELAVVSFKRLSDAN